MACFFGHPRGENSVLLNINRTDRLTLAKKQKAKKAAPPEAGSGPPPDETDHPHLPSDWDVADMKKEANRANNNQLNAKIVTFLLDQ